MSRVLAVGDIHTKLWVVKSVEGLIDNYDAVIFVGDYADDWNATPLDSIATWEALKKLQEDHPQKIKLVTGNHDYIYVNKTLSLQSGYNHVTQLLINSQENAGLKEWLKSLPITIKIDGVTYSHAGLTVFYTEGHELWDDDSPLWARPDGEEYQDIPQAFGHTPSKTCWEVKPNVWCIDTHSTFPDGKNVGDNSLLEIVDGEQFKVVNLRGKEL